MQSWDERFPRVGHDANATPPDVPWLVDGMWLRNGINVLLGPEKAGKSRLIGFVLAQMLARPAGGPVLWRADGNGPCAHHHGIRRVLYLNAEERAVDVQARLNLFARAQGLTPRDDWPIDYVSATGMQLQRAQDRAELEKAWLQGRQYDMMILDPLRRVHGGDENNNSAMALIHNDLRRWTNHYSLAMLIVHHSPKFREDDDLTRIATWSRGNSDLATLLDGATMLRHSGTGDGYEMRMLKRDGRFPPLPDVELRDFGNNDQNGRGGFQAMSKNLLLGRRG